MERWKIAFREYERKRQARQRNEHRVYALILGQCLLALRNWMEADAEWSVINGCTDVMGLLRLIQKSVTQRQTLRYPDSTLLDAMDSFYQFKQGENMDNHDYYEEFKDRKNIAE